MIWTEMLGSKMADQINSVSRRNRATNVMRKSNKPLRTELYSSTPSVFSLQLLEGELQAWPTTPTGRAPTYAALRARARCQNWTRTSCCSAGWNWTPRYITQRVGWRSSDRDCCEGCQDLTQWPSFTSSGQMSSSECAGPSPAFCCCGNCGEGEKKLKWSFSLLLSLNPEEENERWPLLLWTRGRKSLLWIRTGGSGDVSHAHFTVTEWARRGRSCRTPVPSVPENIWL